MNSVRVVGLGAVSGNGLSKENIFQSVLTGRNNINDIGLCSLSEADWQNLSAKAPARLQSSRCTQMSFHALSSALAESGWNEAQLRDCGFVFASTTSQIDLWEKSLPQYRSLGPALRTSAELPSSVKNQSLGLPLLSLCENFGIQGPRVLVASSCSASLQALAIARMWILSKKVKRCIVGATEIQSDLTRLGFQSLRLMSTKACRPFDRARSGINLGEASAFLLLEEDSSTHSPAHWGHVLGAGLSSDAFHSTSPSPGGVGSGRAMQMALQTAKIPPEKIDWIYAHGTGSAANDLAEAQAIVKNFPTSVWTNSSKAIHGHSLAASGALESVLGLMAMKNNFLLGTKNCSDPDPDLRLNIDETCIEKDIHFFLKNSLGFGGINASVIFGKAGSA